MFDASKFLKNLEGPARQRVNAGAERAVNTFAQHVIGQAQILAPVDSGDLKGSGVAMPAEVDGEKVTAVIGFSVAYSAAVHERLDVHHEQGQAKFLETAMNRNGPSFRRHVQDEIKKALS